MRDTYLKWEKGKQNCREGSFSKAIILTIEKEMEV